MAKIKPFRGFRPRADLVSKVAAPPYDVVSSEEAWQMAKDNPYCFLHITKAEIDLPRKVELYDEAVYQKGKENLRKFIAEGILIQDEKPCFYIYRQIMGNINQIGLVAGASIEDYENDVIKKHEHTRADKEADRIKHVDTLNANTGPVFLTYPAQKDIDKLTAELTKEKPLYDFTTGRGVRQSFWKVEDEKKIKQISEMFSKIGNLYVADGHHRSASATVVGQRRRAANPHHTGDEEYNYFLAVIFPHHQLHIMDYNRVVKDLNGLSKENFLKKVSENFEITKIQNNEPYKPEKLHTFGMYLDGKWYKLTAKDKIIPKNAPVKSLDVSILQENLLAPILGIGDPRTDDRIDFVGGIRGLHELENRVDNGEAVAFSMYPTSIEELISIADADKVMPPKSTWFEPKLCSGVIVHMLD